MDIWVDSTSAITNGASINTEFLFAVLRAATLRAGPLGPMATPCAAVGRVALSWPSQQRRARPRHPCATLIRRGLRSSVTYPGSHGGGRAELGLQAGPETRNGRSSSSRDAGTQTRCTQCATAADPDMLTAELAGQRGGGASTLHRAQGEFVAGPSMHVNNRRVVCDMETEQRPQVPPPTRTKRGWSQPGALHGSL